MSNVVEGEFGWRWWGLKCALGLCMGLRLHHTHTDLGLAFLLHLPRPLRMLLKKQLFAWADGAVMAVRHQQSAPKREEVAFAYLRMGEVQLRCGDRVVHFYHEAVDAVFAADEKLKGGDTHSEHRRCLLWLLLGELTTARGDYRPAWDYLLQAEDAAEHAKYQGRLVKKITYAQGRNTRLQAIANSTAT